MIKKTGFTILIFVMVFVFCCGKKGPLVLEPELIPKAVENFKIFQLGDNIMLQWDFPRTLADRENTPLELENIRKINIYYSNKEIPDGKFKKKARLLKKLQWEDLMEVPKPLTSPAPSATSSTTPTASGTPAVQSSYFVTIPFSLKELDNKPHFWGVQYYYLKKASPLSSIVYIQTAIPVKPVTDLKANLEKKLVKLTWSKPQLDAAGNPIASITGYNIYKKIDPEEGKETKAEPTSVQETTSFRKINANNVLAEYYEDTDTGLNGKYSYYVTAVISAQIESAPSAAVSIQVSDIYPPDIPANLVCFKAQDHLFLTWRPATDPDLSHYRLYRRSADQEEFQLLADKITSTSYKDTNLQKGKTYFYAVTAVDLKGNESPFSQEVKEQF